MLMEMYTEYWQNGYDIHRAIMTICPTLTAPAYSEAKSTLQKLVCIPLSTARALSYKGR